MASDEVGMMNSTIQYYNNCAEEYFDRTAHVEFDNLYDRFLKHVPEGGRIMDLGCGSGRDVYWFINHGYEAYGLDAADNLVIQARDKLGVPVEAGRIEAWSADEPFDGIWCCASLMHIDDEGINSFFKNLKHNLKPNGVLFMSVKEGIDTGMDKDGRYFKDFSEDYIKSFLNKNPELSLINTWHSEDKMGRDTFRWLNALIKRG